VKNFVLLVGFFCLAFAARAQDPGVQQDAEAAREKLLKAADELDLIESNSEANKAAMEGMKGDIAKLQDENTTLKQQVADLQAAFDKAEAAHARERQVLLDEVAKMVAAGKVAGKKKDAAAATPPVVKTPETETAHPAPATNSDVPSGTDPTAATADNAGSSPATEAKPQKGYYHIVDSGETLSLICTAYRQKGINVTIAEIEKANGLTDKTLLKVGQKLFIPKPGT